MEATVANPRGRQCVTCKRAVVARDNDRHVLCRLCRVCCEGKPCATCKAWTPAEWSAHAKFEKGLKKSPPPAPPSESADVSAVPMAPPRETRRGRSRRQRSSESTSSSETSDDRSSKRSRRHRHRRSRSRLASRGRSPRRHSSRRRSSRSHSRSRRDRFPSPSEVVTRDMLSDFMEEMRGLVSRERAPATPDPAPPAGLAPPVQSETLSILASDEAWEDEFEEGMEGPGVPLTERGSDEGQIPVLVRQSAFQTLPVTASLDPGVSATQSVSDEVLFPKPPILAPSPLVDLVPDILSSMEKEFHVGVRERPAPPGGSMSRLRLGAAVPAALHDARSEFPMDTMVLERFRRWSRGSMRDWSSFNRDQNAAIRVFDSDFEAVLRVPEIPRAVWNLLIHPPSGPPKALFTAAKGYRLKDAESQRREDSLRATDRAIRMAIKCQALSQWSAEAATAVIQSSQFYPRVEPLMQGLGCLSQATIDQLARASVKLVAERRELLFPFLGLSQAVVADLRRLPLEGPDLFAGHFEHVLARQAGQQDMLKRNLKFLSKSQPQRAAARPSTRGVGGRGQQSKRKTFSAFRPPAASTSWSGEVSVSRGGRRSFRSSATASRGRGRGRKSQRRV